MKCQKCGEDLKRAMVLALMLDMGCRSNCSPDVCSAGGAHEWAEETDKPAPPAHDHTKATDQERKP